MLMLQLSSAFSTTEYRSVSRKGVEAGSAEVTDMR
jgi:hypothetical protein